MLCFAELLLCISAYSTAKFFLSSLTLLVGHQEEHPACKNK